MAAAVIANIITAISASPHSLTIVATAIAVVGAVALAMPPNRTPAERRLDDLHARSRDGPPRAGSGIGSTGGRYVTGNASAATGGGDHRTGIMAVIASAVAALRGGATMRDAFLIMDGHERRTNTRSPAAVRQPAHSLTEHHLYDLLARHALPKETGRQITDAAMQIALAARLGERIGCPAVLCLEAVEQSHRRSRLLADSREQALAVPQATIRLLSALPAVTVLLGELMGAHPVGFLFASAAGLGCLLTGGGFHAAGMAWTAAMLRDTDDGGVTGWSVGRTAGRAADDGFARRRRRTAMVRHVPDTLVLALLDAAMRQGASIPSALDAVGECLTRCGGDGSSGFVRFAGGGFGETAYRVYDGVADAAIGAGLRAVAAALVRGVGWDAAWTLAGDADGLDGDGDSGDDAIRLFRALRDALGPSWRQGVPPSARLGAMMEQMDADERARIETSTAKLSVRLLLPTGLCFLPSFIMIGIVPSIVSFIA